MFSLLYNEQFQKMASQPTSGLDRAMLVEGLVFAEQCMKEILAGEG